MGANLMYSPLETTFKETMRREGITLTTFTRKIEFQAFCRIRNDNENQRETVIIYYDAKAPVRSGTLVVIRDGIFIALNRESIENDVYYKSTLVKCNGVFNDNEGEIFNIPFYSGNMKSSVSIGNNVVNMLNGNIELITEENMLSKQINIDSTFNEFDRTFKVTNKYSIDGITHIIAEVYANTKPKYTYDVRIEGLDNSYVEPDTTLQLTALPYINNNIAMTNATFEWGSSDSSVAIVDNTGKVTFLSEGEVDIIVIWVEKNIETRSTVTVTDNENFEKWTMEIQGREDLKIGYPRTYTIITKLNNTETYLPDVQYEIINLSTDIEFEMVNFNASNNTLKLQVEKETMIRETFTIRAYHTEKGIEAVLNIRITSLW